MTPEEYLAWEREEPYKHQYIGGEVFAMSGGKPRHNVLGANTTAVLFNALRGTGCRALSSDQKVYCAATGDYVYPDVTVVCGPIELRAGTTDVILNPRIVVEVLSKSTDAHDRGGKWEDYRQIPTLTDYLLVSQRVARVEHFARQTDGAWLLRVIESGQEVHLTTGAVLLVDELFTGAFEVPGDDDG